MNDQRGSATVLAASIVSCVLAAGVAAGQVGMLIAAQHRAAAAADLAALTGTRASLRGADACAAAEQVARANGAAVAECRVDLAVTTVTTRVSAPTLWGRAWTFEDRSRAAPADYVPSAPASSASSKATAPALSSG